MARKKKRGGGERQGDGGAPGAPGGGPAPIPALIVGGVLLAVLAAGWSLSGSRGREAAAPASPVATPRVAVSPSAAPPSAPPAAPDSQASPPAGIVPGASPSPALDARTAPAPANPEVLPQSTAVDPMLQPRPGPPVMVPCEVEGVGAAYTRGVTLQYEGRTAEAVAAFQEALRVAPECNLVRVALSKALLAAKDRVGAKREADQAYAQLEFENDRARRIVYAWWWHLKGLEAAPADAPAAFERERSILDYALVLFPSDPELWVLRAEASDGPIHAAPFHYIAHRLAPDHPACRAFRMPPPPPVPTLPLVPLARLAAPDTAPRLHEGLGALSQPVSTTSTMAQRYYDQGLRCFHSYVTPSTRPDSAARCFHQAIALDSHCAMAYWGLSFCVSPTDALKPAQAAATAYHLAMQFGTDKERRLCAARVLELAGPSVREAFIDALDAAIVAYPTDVEIWIWRGKIYGQYGVGSDEEMTLSEKVLAGMPFELAAHLLKPDHPAPNHELIHTYEQIDRPALGWPYTFQFRDAAPNMPHANHMQAHLAMRLGRWDDALAATRRAARKALEGYPELDPGHHTYVLALALAHEGRFEEALQSAYEARLHLAWARLLRLQCDQVGLRQWVEETSQRPTVDSLYVKVLVELDDGKIEEARATLAVLERAHAEGKIANDYKLREARARMLCATGQVERGLKLFRETAWASVTDGSYHFFGGGGYFPEVWGEEALRRGRLDQAGVAFHEALAHEHGSIVAALGMQVLSEQRGKPDLARHYAARAARIWAHADPGFLERQLARLRALATSAPPPPPLPRAPATVRSFEAPRKATGP